MKVVKGLFVASLLVGLVGLVWTLSVAGQGNTAPVREGAKYIIRACFNSPVSSATFELAFFSLESGFGEKLAQQNARGQEEGDGCWRSDRPGVGPCVASSARYGVATAEGLSPSSLELVEAQGPDGSCSSTSPPSLTPGPTSTAQPTPTLTPQPTSKSRPGGESSTPPSLPGELPRVSLPPIDAPPGDMPPPSTPYSPAEEPEVFAQLANGSFEIGRGDGTPYGWRKYGGAMQRATGLAVKGNFSLRLTSDSPSTKWAYQTVTVEGGEVYELAGYALKNDPNVEALWLRISWYATDDGSGQAIAYHDSPALSEDGPQFRFLSTGPVTAPQGAKTAKVRLMLRPRSSVFAQAHFDEISFGPSSLPPQDLPPATEEETLTSTTQAQTPTSSPHAAARSSLADEGRSTPRSGGGRPPVSPGLLPSGGAQGATSQGAPPPSEAEDNVDAFSAPELANMGRRPSPSLPYSEAGEGMPWLAIGAVGGGLAALGLLWAGGEWWHRRLTRTRIPGPDGKC